MSRPGLSPLNVVVQRLVEADECLAFAMVEGDGARHGDIVTGVEELVRVPLPNWPQSFVPQHRTLPSPMSAQLWCHQPPVRAWAPAIQDTGTGLDEVIAVPLPS